MLYIKNGCVMDPKTGLEKTMDIITKDDKIWKMGEQLDKTELFRRLPKHEMQIIDAEGYIVAPGLVDVHVHFRDPGFTEKEDIFTGAKAAARGGFTSVVLMANTNPVVDQPETLQYVLEKGKETAIHVYSCCSVTEGMRGEKLTDMEQLYQQGAVGFTDDGKPILEESVVREAMEECARLQVPISFHEEDPAYIKENGINAGEAAAYYKIQGSDRMAEISMVKRDLELALQTGACINIQHISTAEAVEMIREAKKRGGDIHAEATPHHFTLTEEAVKKYGSLAKMNPPLRTEKDREAIVAGLQDGTIDLIATDHAPHTRAEKAKPITEAPSGIIGLETALALGITELVKTRKLTMMELLRKMTWNPARMYHLDAGYLEEGGPADMVIFDPDSTQTFFTFYSKSSNTPFAGKTCKSTVEYTISDGKVAYIECMGMNELDD
ncbi:MAG: dihydroorotase [Lachnospiraceae bacterium]